MSNVTSRLNGWRWRFDAWHFMTQQRDLRIIPSVPLVNLDTFDTKATLSKSRVIRVSTRSSAGIFIAYFSSARL